MVKLFQRCPDENLLLYILLKIISEQSGNNYDVICYSYLFSKFPEVSQCFYLLPEIAQSFYWHGKENYSKFRTIPEASMTIHF